MFEKILICEQEGNDWKKIFLNDVINLEIQYLKLKLDNIWKEREKIEWSVEKVISYYQEWYEREDYLRNNALNKYFNEMPCDKSFDTLKRLVSN